MNIRVPLPAGTVLGKSFEHGLDVNLASFAAPSWQPFRRISAWLPTYPPATSDVGTYDDFGNPNEAVTGRGFATSFTAQGNRSLATGLLLPELEATIAASKGTLEGAVLDVRWYHKPEIGTPNPNDAGRAFCRVEANRQNPGNAEIEVYAITLTGQGGFTPIPNPFTGWAATPPAVTYVSPVGATDGTLLTITGSGFLTATSVTIDGDPAEFEPVNGATIIALLPDGDAGTVPIIVTSPAGASPSYAFTRGA